ncbi:MAG: aldehyde dehydrogenase family protein [Neisseriaceae bacterium]|nr:aldehyde dehydrogenase family protein [Neisseriaceae bacterium]
MKPAAYEQFDLQPIGHQLRPGATEAVLTDVDPYTQAPILTLRMANQADVDEAYETAATEQVAWAQTLPNARAQVLRQVATIIEARFDELTQWLVKESGSTVLKAGIELDSAKNIVLASAAMVNNAHGLILPSAIEHQESHAYRAPLGVIGVISPWNFPFHLSMRSVAPALALGNAVVIKPASDTPVTGGLLLAKIFAEAGLPSGLLSVVVGAGRDIGDYFVTHPVPALISFTGSSQVGHRVGQMAMGQPLKRVALELGGNAPLVVLDDADVEEAAHAAVVGRFLHQGQICMSTNRVIVAESIHDAFVAAVLKRVKALKVGSPAEPDTVVGPLINPQQVASVRAKIEQAKKDGATLLFGGEIKGQLVPPHVFVDVQPEWDIAAEETFGPVLPILKAKDDAHALVLANASQYGLSSAVFTQDQARGLRFARGIRAGMTHINDISVDDQTNAPFGGEKNSGLGRFNGPWVLEEFTRLQWVTIQTQPRPYPF